MSRLVACASMLLLAACGTHYDATVVPAATAGDLTHHVVAAKTADQVIVTENDITDRRYRALGDISVSVKKWTIFDADPTREAVAQAMREKAAEMGADAVVLARYGSVGIGFTSWGEMDGNGRAVVFEK